MSGEDEDDKPTVVLDLNALKKQKLKAEEDLANIASELEFNVGQDEPAPKPKRPPPKMETTGTGEVDSETFAERFLDQREKESPASASQFKVLLFDFNSDFFQKSKAQFPKGFEYKVLKTLPELNQSLRSKDFQIVVFNYDVNPRAVNQLCAQIKQKFPVTKTMIMAKNISPEKARLHAKTPSGASGYYQFPLDPSKVEKEFQKIHSTVKKVS